MLATRTCLTLWLMRRFVVEVGGCLRLSTRGYGFRASLITDEAFPFGLIEDDQFVHEGHPISKLDHGETPWVDCG